MNNQGTELKRGPTVACFGQSGAGKTTFLGRYSQMAKHSDFRQEDTETITVSDMKYNTQNQEWVFKLIDCHGVSDEQCDNIIFHTLESEQPQVFLIFLRAGRMISQEAKVLRENLKKFKLTPENCVLILTYNIIPIDQYLITTSQNTVQKQVRNDQGQNVNVITRRDGHTNKKFIEDMFGFLPTIVTGDQTKQQDYDRMGQETLNLCMQKVGLNAVQRNKDGCCVM